MKNEALLALKGFAIIGVVFYHVANRRFDPSVRDMLWLIPSVFSWCVLGFFAISGWFAGLSTNKGERSFAVFVGGRALRLLFPFAGLIMLYAVVWQLVQALNLLPLSGGLDHRFFWKIGESLWPAGGNEVAEQLYFLPLLFAISAAIDGVRRILGALGPKVVCVGSFLAGSIWFPASPNTGFSLGVLVWGLFTYSGGYWLQLQNEKKWANILMMAAAIMLFLADGFSGLHKVLPLVLVFYADALYFARVPLFKTLGAASGTIFIYHTPFILQPLVIVASFLPSRSMQFIGGVLSAFVAMGLCCLVHFYFNKTKLKWLTM